ncbi:hypothetical protein T4B_1939 [Trichinella pseudospiralis]|uniref:Uncharacterized protein n=1 Tax=Trichinella pseudospiralis TaxID=6337 RepID=A0A0V1J7L8_TRIPS|nr:hypothetical protein T4B_1939 [Trichinella pseudospiralis]
MKILTKRDRWMTNGQQKGKIVHCQLIATLKWKNGIAKLPSVVRCKCAELSMLNTERERERERQRMEVGNLVSRVDSAKNSIAHSSMLFTFKLRICICLFNVTK